MGKVVLPLISITIPFQGGRKSITKYFKFIEFKKY